MPSFTTPMMKQYQKIKEQYKDCLLLYRMGDFYELFMEDAFIGAQILNITLTHKRGGKDGNIPMAGIPYHAVDSYLGKLIKAGYKVAVCEQLSPPNKKGLVKRDVIRVVTPGTVLDEKALEKKTNNYIISLLVSLETVALSIADISTGYFATTEKNMENKNQFFRDELSKLSPVECILPEDLYNDPDILKLLKKESNMNIFCFKEWEQYANNAHNFLTRHFGLSTLSAFGIENKSHALKTSAALLGYLQTTQKTPLKHIKKISLYEKQDCLVLDRSTMANLELFATLRQVDPKGSLLFVLDETQTAMGGRLLKEWIKMPLLDKEEIQKRHDVVDYCMQNQLFLTTLRQQLAEITDIERLLSRLSVNIGNARDMVNLKESLSKILEIKKILEQNLFEPSLQKYCRELQPQIENIVSLITTHIVEEPPIDTKSGGIIKKGINKTLDKLRFTITNSKDWMKNLEKKEREKTGISSLKVKYNQVFGFYIEVSKPNLHLVPKEYFRRQTLVNGERFVTQDLKKHEEIILTAEEKANQIEYEIFTDILQKLLEYTTTIQIATQTIATIDCLSNFAWISQKYNYTRPTLLYSGEIRIEKGRHAVVERLLDTESQFVPNDVCLDNVNQSLLLITGPNMAGKSVFLRQVALIVLLSQIGCFVPAEKAHLSLVDRIFVRSGASDMITSGLSTFMVEMVETAYILHNATEKSLIVMDEIGRGTSTYDGISLAWAVAQYLVTSFKSSPKTLFATHYHELQALEEKYPNAIKNFHMAVTNQNDEPIFLHTLLKGGASHSFGIAVAKSAGIPEKVLTNASQMLATLENRDTKDQAFLPSDVRTVRISQNFADHLIQKELENMDVVNMTPLEALNKLAALKEKMKIVEKTQENFLEAD